VNDTTGAPHQGRTILILAITFGVVFFDRNATNFLMPLMRDELHLDYTRIGLIASGLSLTWALAGLLGGAISDKTGTRKVPLLIAVIAFSLCSFFSGLAASFAALLLVRLLMGLAEGPILPIAQSLVAAESSAERRGHNMGVMQNFGSALFGSFLAPVVLIALANAFGWRASFFIAGLPGLVMAFFIWRYIDEPAAARGVPAAAVAQRMHPLEMLRYRNMLLCMMISVVMVAWMVLGWVFLPQYYTAVRGMSPSEMSWQVGILGLSAAAFSFIVPALSDRFGRRPIVVLFCLIGVLVPLVALYFQGSPYVLATLVFAGWSASATFPLFMGTIPSETIPHRLLATGLGLVMGVGEILGGVAAPTLAGMAADEHGLAAPLVLQGACAAAGAVFALFLKETAPRVTSLRR
jgi:MFS transporter, ACS family, hexuronate transporter